MRKVAIVNQSSGYLTIDIVNSFAERYNEVVLIAGRIGESERALSSRVKVDSICPYNRNNTFSRIITWIKGYWQIKRKIKLNYKDYEVVYITNPPMSYFAAYHTDNPYSIVVYDIYPDALNNVGIKSSNPIYWFWAKNNIILFARAQKVITLSDSMAKVLSKYVSREKITIIPNWSGSDSLAPIPKNQNDFAIRLHLANKFVVMYSGNMGFTHSVDVLVDVADMVKDNEDIHFLFVGEGQKRPIIEKRIKELGLRNCSVLGQQPLNVFPLSIACADLGVITLNEDSAAISVPSKTYNLLAVGAPLLCICPQESELAALIKKYDNGRCFQASEKERIADFIKLLASDKKYCSILSRNSLMASSDFSYHNAERYIL